jgi:hypothetical protein
VWRNDSDFVVLENDIVHVYTQFQYSTSIKLSFLPKKLYEGYFLTVAGSDNLTLYNWDRIEKPIHSLPISAHKVWWSEDQSMFLIAAP